MVNAMTQRETGRKKLEAQALPQLESLYRTALYLLDKESDAKDLVQQSFVNACRSWLKRDFSSNFRIWLFKIMLTAFDAEYGLPSAKAGDDVAGEIHASSRRPNRRRFNDFGGDPFAAILDIHVIKAIRHLPPEFRLIVLLSMLEGFSYREIADIAAVKLEIVRFMLHQGRRLMQRELLNHAGSVDRKICLLAELGKRTGAKISMRG